MQTRELTLKELDTAYEFLKNYISLSYDEFENRVYDLRHNSYKMLGMFHKDVLIAYSGVSVMSTLELPRSLWVYEFFVKDEFISRGYDDEMYLYLKDYAKMNQCEALHVKVEKLSQNYYKLLKNREFKKSIESSFTIQL